MSNLIGKIADNAVIFLAAVLTACGVAMAFMPWQALYQKPVQDREQAQAQVHAQSAGFVNSGVFPSSAIATRKILNPGPGGSGQNSLRRLDIDAPKA